jgi:hypothetical protein
MFALSAFTFGARQTVAAAVFNRTVVSRHLARGLQRAVDLDREGYSAVFNGGDCNDRDAHVHPGAQRKAKPGAAPFIPDPVKLSIITASNDGTVLVAQCNPQMPDDLFSGCLVVPFCIFSDVFGIHRGVSHGLPP